MKKNRLYSFAAAAAVLAGTLSSCSSDDIAGSEAPAVSDSKIAYNVGMGGKATRGVGLGSADVASSSLLPNMQVWAYYHPNASGFGVTPGSMYVGESASAGITVTNNGGTWKEDASNTAYWPAESAPLNFQAIAPASDESFSVDNTVSDNLAHMVASVTVPTDNAAQKDILVANTDGVTQGSNARKVDLAFKHVLSQVRFKVQTASQQLSGSIEGISLCNIKQTGTVGYHASDDVVDGDNAWKKVTLGSTVSDDVVASYPLGMAADCSFGSAQFGPGNAKDVTADDGSLLMLPQTTVKWTTADGAAVPISSANAAKNSYIKISCKIKNGATYLVGSDDASCEVYIPFAASWLMGKRYVYTINIGTGTGGFDINGKPVVQPISYSVDVDEWDQIVNADVPDLTHGTENGYEWVDLGLPSGLKWATCNIGASNPQDYGLYFAWGETEGHAAAEVNWNQWEFSEESYLAGSGYPISTNLTLEQDAAHVYLGGNWRMPTKGEFDELRNSSYTTQTWTDDYNSTGAAGYVFTSKSNGNSIFLPAAGYCGYKSVDDQGSRGGYWSGSWVSKKYAWHLYFKSGDISTRNNTLREYGLSVRAVCE